MDHDTRKRRRPVASELVQASREGRFLRGNVTKLKMLLPVGKPQAWALIATPEGLASWFPAACFGRAAIGETLTFRWDDGSEEQFHIRRLGERHSAVTLSWRDGAEWRIYLHGRRTTLTLEVEYKRGEEGRREQLRELPLWSFRLANLKSVAVHGRDLRRKEAEPRGSAAEGFIDGFDRRPRL